MSGLLIFGLVGLGAGVFGWLISGWLSNFASDSYSRLNPGSNRDLFRRRNVTGIRVISSVMLLLGLGFVIFVLLGGR